MKAKTTRRALLMSALSLLLCVSMLIGTTFAWFTDTVVSDKNIIQSGNLDVVLEYWDGSKYTEVTSTTKLFNDAALWEPGHTEVAYLRVSNGGSLALKYQLNVNIHGETVGYTKEGAEIRLSDHLVFGVTDKQITTSADLYTRETAIAAAGTTKGLKSYNGKTMPLDVKNAEGTSNYEDYVALIIYMPETVGNEANHNGKDVPAIEMGVSLYATQLNSESDSFGPDYDENAWHESMKVYSAQDLQSAIDAGEDVVLMNDVTATDVLAFDGDVKLNLNGKTLTANMSIAENANVVISGGELVSEDGDNSAIETVGNLTLDNVTVDSARHAVRVEGGKTVINGGTYKAAGTPSRTQHALNVSDGGEVVVYGGTFIGPKGTASDSGSAVNVQSGSAVTIYGGNFSGGKNSTLSASGTLIVMGGTFDQDPSAYVADGLKAVESNGKYVIVSDTIADENVVGTEAELESALAGAADAGSGDNTIYMTDDIDLTGSTWTPIKVDGYNGAGVITIEGNGNTIKGLTAPLFAGGFAGKSGIVIKNLTIADSDIVSTSGLGGGAFIDTADSMQVITLENCHLVNSTVTGERTGGLIGWCSGYAKLDDGPVKTYVTISNCSVVDSTVTGAGSAGAIAGHPGASDYTYTTIENCVVKNVDVVSNDSGSWRTGAIVGTANNGHIVINNVSVENVTLTQNGVVAEGTPLYGRFVPSGTGTLVIDGVTVVASNDQLKEAIKNGGNIVFANDITVDKWVMFSETLSIGNGNIITVDEINVSIDGNGHTLTINDIESAGNGDRLFYDATKLNISNLTIKYADGFTAGGFSLTSGVISNVNFVGGGVAVYPGNGDIKIENCTFATNATAIYFEEERDNLTVTGCTFNQPNGTNVILLRGDVEFTNNTVNSGRTVNIVSGSPVVTGNNFNNVRLKVYSAATATVSGNTINNLDFETTTYSSNFADNTLSAEAQAALDAKTKN